MKLFRKLHQWAAWFACLPLFIIILSGVLLSNRDIIPSIQPETKSGAELIVGKPLLTIEKVFEIAQSVPAAKIMDWQDIKSIEVKPQKKIYSVRTVNNYEVQIDFQNETILNQGQRWTNMLVNLHEGSFFKSKAISFLFKTSGVVFLILYISGIAILLYPKLKKSKEPK